MANSPAPRSAPATTPAAIRAALDAIGQGHLLHFAERLGEPERAALLAQVASIDLAGVPGLIERYVKKQSGAAAPVGGAAPSTIEPVPSYALTGGGWDKATYAALGAGLIKSGKVAAFTVAGGQGSRLGYDGPKGCFPGGAVTKKPLFAMLAESILAAEKRYAGAGVSIPWYIMTSPLNHEATTAFFREHRCFGLAEKDVMFFPQGVMPAFDMASGRMLLSEPYEVALSPDGHGGSITALARSGALADMKRRGIEHLSYTQIDNPLVRVIDPVFLGLHAGAPDSSGEMSSKMIPKAHPGEKVGVFCRVGGRTSMIEYSDLPAELAQKTDSAGGAVFNAGNPAIHVLSVAFLERLNLPGSGVALPFHRAEKKVPYVDLGTGAKVEPAKPNAVKLELFVFDALPLCRSSIVVETDRAEEFAPIKNATGADSVETCSAMQTARAARWLEAVGVKVPRRSDGGPDCTLELSPLTALEPADLRGAALPVVTPGSRIAL
ncbi:MAG: UTP--glucose-1-phosphate uridylyltransferase [Phycisphaerales bacterium]